MTMVKNYVASNRGWVVVKRHAPILAKVTAVALLAVALWGVARYFSIYFSAEAQEPLMLGTIPFVGLIYVLFATVAISSVFNRYTRISAAVVKRDLDTFLIYRDEQMPILMHLLIGLPSIIFTVLIGLVDYHSAWVGIAAVFSTAFVLALGWVIAVELDDFNKGIWFQVNVPQHWYEIDLTKHFNHEGQTNGKQAASAPDRSRL